MVQIPVYEQHVGLDTPGAPNIRVDDSVGQAFGQVGNAISNAAAQFDAHTQKMNGYKVNTQLEQWGNAQDVEYQNNLKNGAADGSDLLPKTEKTLADSYAKVRATITDPELQAKADLIFEQTKGRATIKAMQDSQVKGQRYVLATTGDSITSAVKSGSIQSEEQFQDFYEKVVKPRIYEVITDPLDRQKADGVFGEQLRNEYMKAHPERAAMQQAPVNVGSGGAPKGDYKSRVRQIESAGNDNAVSSTGATGRYQFTRGTAKHYGLTDRLDVGQQELAMDALTADNRASLTKSLGRAPSDAELYLAHQQGAGGAAKLLAFPDARAADVVGMQAVKINGGSADMTAGQFAGMWLNKYNGTKGGAPSAPVNPGPPSGGMWDGMSAGEWNGYVKQSREASANMIASTVPDELASLEFSGKSDHGQLMKGDFIAAYGEGWEPRYDKYVSDRDTAIMKNKYADMTSEQIIADLDNRAKNVATGEGAANDVSSLAELQGAAKGIIGERDKARSEFLQEKERKIAAAAQGQVDIANDRNARFADLQREKAAAQTAASQAFEQRKKDPASYVFATNPGVRMAWHETNTNDPRSTSAAIAATIAAQEAIGIPGDDIAPLPAGQAEAIAKAVTDTTKDTDQRIGILSQTVFAAEKPEHQEAVVRQLVKSGLTPKIANVLEAQKRRDTSATRRLFQAAMLDSGKTKLGAVEPGFAKAINEAMVGQGTIGEAFYGIDLGDPNMAEVYASDAELATSAARLAIAGGMEQDAAIDQAVADIFGKVDTVDISLPNGGSVFGLVDSGTDTAAIGKGFAAATAQMAGPVQTYQGFDYAAVDPNATPAQLKLMKADHDNEARRVLADGVWRNIGDRWGFFDPQNRAFIAGADGKPITYGLNEIMSMGGSAGPEIEGPRADPYNLAPPQPSAPPATFGMPPDPAPQSSIDVPPSPDTSQAGQLAAQQQQLFKDGPLAEAQRNGGL